MSHEGEREKAGVSRGLTLACDLNLIMRFSLVRRARVQRHTPADGRVSSRRGQRRTRLKGIAVEGARDFPAEPREEMRERGADIRRERRRASVHVAPV